MKRAQVRSFWRWPVGHRWERVVEAGYSYKRCQDCGRSTPLSSKGDRPPPNLYGGGE